MWEMTSMGEMSAARTTMPEGVELGLVVGLEGGDFRIALTVSLTPRVRDLDFAAIGHKFIGLVRWSVG